MTKLPNFIQNIDAHDAQFKTFRGKHALDTTFERRPTCFFSFCILFICYVLNKFFWASGPDKLVAHTIKVIKYNAQIFFLRYNNAHDHSLQHNLFIHCPFFFINKRFHSLNIRTHYIIGISYYLWNVFIIINYKLGLRGILC